MFGHVAAVPCSHVVPVCWFGGQSQTMNEQHPLGGFGDG